MKSLPFHQGLSMSPTCSTPTPAPPPSIKAVRYTDKASTSPNTISCLACLHSATTHKVSVWILTKSKLDQDVFSPNIHEVTMK